MSLIGSSKTIANSSMRARVEAAIRQAATEKTDASSAAGRLAAQGLMDPGSIAPHFLARLAVNAAVAAAACEDCGFAGVADSDISYVVSAEWDDVAATVYPTTDPQPTA